MLHNLFHPFLILRYTCSVHLQGACNFLFFSSMVIHFRVSKFYEVILILMSFATHFARHAHKKKSITKFKCILDKIDIKRSCALFLDLDFWFAMRIGNWGLFLGGGCWGRGRFGRHSFTIYSCTTVTMNDMPSPPAFEDWDVN